MKLLPVVIVALGVAFPSIAATQILPPVEFGLGLNYGSLVFGPQKTFAQELLSPVPDSLIYRSATLVGRFFPWEFLGFETAGTFGTIAVSSPSTQWLNVYNLSQFSFGLNLRFRLSPRASPYWVTLRVGGGGTLNSLTYHDDFAALLPAGQSYPTIAGGLGWYAKGELVIGSGLVFGSLGLNFARATDTFSASGADVSGNYLTVPFMLGLSIIDLGITKSD
jgi:hypothetical protein